MLELVQHSMLVLELVCSKELVLVCNMVQELVLVHSKVLELVRSMVLVQERSKLEQVHSTCPSWRTTCTS